jgi:hypothetical protein
MSYLFRLYTIAHSGFINPVSSPIHPNFSATHRHLQLFNAENFF